MLNAIEKYYFDKQEPVQSCMLYLRQHLLESDRQMTELYKYGIPFFYFRQKAFCYITVNKKGELYIGFVKGHLLKDKELRADGRKQIKALHIDPEKDINVKILDRILKSAFKLY